MSKMLDELERKSVKKHVPGALGIHDEISRTYFHTSQKKNFKKKPEWKTFLPWLIAAFAALIAVAVFMSRSSIDIKVRLLGEIPAFNDSGRGDAVFDKGFFLVKGGEPQAEIVKNAYFAGDGKAHSYSREEELVLCNARGAGWTNYAIELKEPANFNNLDIKYTAKGAKSNEALILVLVDSNNRVYRMEKDLSSELTGEWKKYTINFRHVRKALDLASIKAIRFEFGSLTTGNYSGAVIYLKDIYLAKTRRLKWL